MNRPIWRLFKGYYVEGPTNEALEEIVKRSEHQLDLKLTMHELPNTTKAHGRKLNNRNLLRLGQHEIINNKSAQTQKM